jgi:predicted XRE-type DNA-binding protein
VTHDPYVSPVTGKRALLAAYRLRRRCRIVSWLIGHGVTAVPIATAARVLGIEQPRVRYLVKSGRLPIIGPMPGGRHCDRFVPTVALLEAPSELERGRPLMRGENESVRRDVPLPNGWASGSPYPQSVGELQDFLEVPKSLVSALFKGTCAQRPIRMVVKPSALSVDRPERTA